MEIWRNIDDSYEVSSYGNVKSKDINGIRKYKNGFRKYIRKGKLLTKVPSIDGYLRVKIHGQNVSLSHLVATAFIPNPNGYTVVHHKDHDITNNHVENLEWIDKEEHDKLHCEERKIKVYQYTIDGRLIKVWDSAQDAAIELGLNQSHIWHCCNNKRKTHGGFKWSYAALK